MGGGATLTSDEVKFLAEAQMPVKFDESEINRIVGDVISLMEDTPSTRSGGTRTVAEIRPLPLSITTDASTRSGSEAGDDLVYVVNFENDEGYSLIAADRRIQDEVIAFVGHGSFPDGEIENPGLQVMMSNIDDYTTRSIAKYEKWRDSVEVALLERMDAESVEAVLATLDIGSANTDTRADVYYPWEPSWETTDRVGPLIPVEWGQYSPFNVRATAELGRTVVAGCVAVAAAQLMAYWKWPKSYYEYDNIDWDTLCEYTGPNEDRAGAYRTWTDEMGNAPAHIKQMCTDILWHIGDDVNMNWGTTSYAYSSDARLLLSRLGFSTPPEPNNGPNYTKSIVENSIKNHRPVFIQGGCYLLEGTNFSDGNHAWLIDGYLEQRWWDYFRIDHHIYEIEKFRDFFHNNFGWSGDDNGFYTCGLFDANNGPGMPSDTRGWIGEGGNYQYSHFVYVDIHR